MTSRRVTFGSEELPFKNSIPKLPLRIEREMDLSRSRYTPKY